MDVLTGGHQGPLTLLFPLSFAYESTTVVQQGLEGDDHKQIYSG